MRMIPRGSHSIQFERFLIVNTKTGKKKNLWKSMMGRRPGMTFEQRERAIGMLTAGMSARDVARLFQRHESTVSRLLNRFQQFGNVADRPRSGRPRKTMPREDRFLTDSSGRNKFLSSNVSCRHASGKHTDGSHTMVNRHSRPTSHHWFSKIFSPVFCACDKKAFELRTVWPAGIIRFAVHMLHAIFINVKIYIMA